MANCIDLSTRDLTNISWSDLNTYLDSEKIKDIDFKSEDAVVEQIAAMLDVYGCVQTNAFVFSSNTVLQTMDEKIFDTNTNNTDNNAIVYIFNFSKPNEISSVKFLFLGALNNNKDDTLLSSPYFNAIVVGRLNTYLCCVRPNTCEDVAIVAYRNIVLP